MYTVNYMFAQSSYCIVLRTSILGLQTAYRRMMSRYGPTETRETLTTNFVYIFIKLLGEKYLKSKFFFILYNLHQK